ncbi:MAG TPA: hypothetical protein VJ208_01930 [Candidatus Nanoarchaeia archaeon]|nr:hypothetical protein [Candidatus Nanoarchaeia archaeon]
MGYNTRIVKEGYQVLDENNAPLTVIPYRSISRGVFYGIRKALKTGKSDFRKRDKFI